MSGFECMSMPAIFLCKKKTGDGHFKKLVRIGTFFSLSHL